MTVLWSEVPRAALIFGGSWDSMSVRILSSTAEPLVGSFTTFLMSNALSIISVFKTLLKSPKITVLDLGLDDRRKSTVSITCSTKSCRVDTGASGGR